MFNNRSGILARRVIQQMLGDRRTLALMCVVPVLLLSFLGILIRNEPGKLVIGVVNEDAGFSLAGATVNLGERLTDVLVNFGEFETQTMTAAEARDQLREGDADAVITLGPDFTQNVIQTRALTLSVEYEGSNPDSRAAAGDDARTRGAANGEYPGAGRRPGGDVEHNS